MLYIISDVDIHINHSFPNFRNDRKSKVLPKYVTVFYPQNILQTCYILRNKIFNICIYVFTYIHTFAHVANTFVVSSVFGFNRKTYL